MVCLCGIYVVYPGVGCVSWCGMYVVFHNVYMWCIMCVVCMWCSMCDVSGCGVSWYCMYVVYHVGCLCGMYVVYHGVGCVVTALLLTQDG